MSHQVPRSAAIYARISHDPSGERLGVQRQEADCVEEARRRGWQVAHIYVDDDRSAYSTRKPRPEYQRLLSDIQLGMRDGVLIWRLDRLHRQPRELEEFIVLCDKHHVALATVTGDVDLSTSQGRLLARAWGAFAAHESEVRGERLARASLDRARRGIVHVPARPYGFNPGGLTVSPHEASVIKEAAARLLAGDTLRSICMDLNRRGVPTAMRMSWHTSVLRRVLGNPRLAGLSTYHGEIVGKGIWNQILSKPQSERLRALLSDPTRRHNNGERSAYLLRGLLRCGRCRERLSTGRKDGQRRYSCIRNATLKGCGRVSIPADEIETHMIERICERLDSQKLADTLHREHVTDRRWRRAKKDVDIAERRLECMARDYATGSLTRKEWLAARPALLERVHANRAALTTDRSETVIADFVGTSRNLRFAWTEFPPSRRHAVATALIEHVVVWPAASTRPDSIAERLLVWWRGEPRPRAPRRSDGQGIAERRATGAFDRCGVPTCVEPFRSNGYCTLHLQRVRKTGEPGEAARKRLAPYRGQCCLVDGCHKVASSAGRCQPHYREWRRNDPSRPRCAVDGCDRGAEAAEWCWKHYMRIRRHGTVAHSSEAT